MDNKVLPPTLRVLVFQFFLDKLICLIILALVLPLCAYLMAYSVYALKKQPIFTQPRVGMDGKRFLIWKIKTMHNEDTSEPRLGWMRTTGADELLQVLQVLLGGWDKSLIGHRALMVEHDQQINDRLGSHYRYWLPAGITGELALFPGSEAEQHDAAESCAITQLLYMQRIRDYVPYALRMHVRTIIIIKEKKKADRTKTRIKPMQPIHSDIDRKAA